MKVAEQRVNLMQDKIFKDYNNQEKAQKSIIEEKEMLHEIRKKQHEKRTIAQTNVSSHLRQLDKRSLSGYSLKLKEVEEMK